MAPRTLGIEEELLLVDPRTRRASARAPQVLKAFREHGPGRRVATAATDEIDQELFRHQLEVRTDPSADAAALHAQVIAARRTAGGAAEAVDLALAACGIVPAGYEEVAVSPRDRYRDMVDTFGEVARTGGTCAMHVHVGVDGDEEGVAIIDRITPWLPVLLAISANSPFSSGRDTTYASWRQQVWSRWPSAGPTEQFGSAARYREVAQTMLRSGAARDEGMLYFDARLAARHPTVEVRVADVCTDPEDALLVAVLVRALAETAARAAAAGTPAPRWRAESVRVAQWRAARYGLAGQLVHPQTQELAAATQVLADLVTEVRDALEEAGDTDRVERGLARVLAGGGATRQRAAFERTGSVEGVVDDLIARTRASWSTSEWEADASAAAGA
ncbi:carboxylate-amine ligase [Nocardioides pantholopis]|uniref:carboxylate-amine ligase n=1 Tax=Nocardioides pantholopis TaxID=2483798 RepID=UPI000FDB20C3|nr:glutamate--cysteine ligase [Nocardioides pantholopis]